MTPYEVIVTSVHDRGDLLDRTLRTMLSKIDLGERPQRIIVHEDARAGLPFVAGRTEQLLAQVSVDYQVPIRLIATNPGGGLGRALLRVLDEATTDFVFYTQEDFDFLRPLPIQACLDIMERYELHHVRFNKRKTMRCKGEDRPEAERFYKVEVKYDGQTLCISDHWYFQASLWRRRIVRDGFAHLAGRAIPGRMIDFCEVQFNRWYNTTHGADRDLREPRLRQERLRTFIWGGIGEPAFIKHTGHDRRSQGWEERTRNPNS